VEFQIQRPRKWTKERDKKEKNRERKCVDEDVVFAEEGREKGHLEADWRQCFIQQ
jgi:hypothetical protein